jgi:hypothetical protein
MLERLACRIFGHQKVTTTTTHPIGLDTIALRVDCSKCHKTLTSWPPPLGAPSGATRFWKPEPVLPVSDLDPRAWSVMCQRQDHLAIEQVRNHSDRAMLIRLEDRAAVRVSRRYAMGRRQSNSLVDQHRRVVEQKLSEALPMFSGVAEPRSTDGVWPAVRYHPRIRVPGVLSFTVEWGTWFRNRQPDFQLLRFRVRILKAHH